MKFKNKINTTLPVASSMNPTDIELQLIRMGVMKKRVSKEQWIKNAKLAKDVKKQKLIVSKMVNTVLNSSYRPAMKVSSYKGIDSPKNSLLFVKKH